VTSEPERLHDEPVENHKANASSQVFPTAKKKIWLTPTVTVEKFAHTEAAAPPGVDGGIRPGSSI